MAKDTHPRGTAGALFAVKKTGEFKKAETLLEDQGMSGRA
jgi:hypothetical protein